MKVSDLIGVVDKNELVVLYKDGELKPTVSVVWSDAPDDLDPVLFGADIVNICAGNDIQDIYLAIDYRI